MTWLGVAIDGSAAELSGRALIVVVNKETRETGTLDPDADHLALLARIHEGEIDALAEARRLRRLSPPVEVKPGWSAITVRPQVKRYFLGSGGQLFPDKLRWFSSLSDEPGVEVGLGSDAELAVLHETWAERARQSALAAGDRFLEALEKKDTDEQARALSEMEAAATAGTYGIAARAAYRWRVLLGFVHAYCGDVVALRRQYELVIAPSFQIAWDAWVRDVQDVTTCLRIRASARRAASTRQSDRVWGPLSRLRPRLSSGLVEQAESDVPVPVSGDLSDP